MADRSIMTRLSVAFPRRLDHILIVCLSVLAILLAITVRITNTASRGAVFGHDESLSFLGASGKFEAYKSAPQLNSWAPAAQWQAYLRPDSPFIFRQIAFDVAYHHPHPPAYFWLLHIWITLLNVSAPWTGSALNLLFDVGTGLALFRLIYACCQSKHAAIAATALWSLHPIAVRTSYYGRPYALFTLLAVLFAYLLFAIFIKPADYQFRRLPALGFVLAAAGGMLTNYYFFLVIGAGVLFALIVYWRSDRRRLAFLFGCLALAAAVVLIMAPEYLSTPALYRTGKFGAVSQTIGTLKQITNRWPTVRFVITFLSTPAVIGFALFGIGHFAVVAARRSESSVVPPLRDFLYITAFALSVGGGTVILYLIGVSMAHALGRPQYYGPAWPFFAAIPFATVGFIKHERLRSWLLVLSCILFLGWSALQCTPDVIDYFTTARAAPPKLTIERVVIDEDARGLLLPIVAQINKETPTFVALQDYLIGNPQSWAPQLSAEGGIYVKLGGRGATEEGAVVIVALIEQENADVYHLEPKLWPAEWPGEFYYVVPRDLPQNAGIQPADWQVGPDLALVGYRVDQNGAAVTTVSPGQELVVTLYWQAVKLPASDYAAFVEVEDRTAGLVAQSESAPAGGLVPTSIWKPGDIFTSIHSVTISTNQANGPLRILVGMMMLTSNERLLVRDGRSLPADSRIPLLELALKP